MPCTIYSVVPFSVLCVVKLSYKGPTIVFHNVSVSFRSIIITISIIIYIIIFTIFFIIISIII